MERFITLACLLLIFIIGFLNLLRQLQKNRKKVEFAKDFLEKLFQYLQSQGRNGEAYVWLTHRSVRMQRQMGNAGRMASYSPPYSRVRYANYEIIVNLLPLIRQTLADRISMTDNLADSYASTLHESIVRYIGIVDDNSENLSEKIRNPFICFTTGVGLLISLPIQILNWFGLIGKSVLLTLTLSRVFKFIVAVASLIGFVSAVVGLVTGWEQFVTLMKPFILKMSAILHLDDAKK